MKKIYGIILPAFLVVSMVMGLGGAAWAFHDGGVAACDGCHTMHNSLKSVKVTVKGTVLNGNDYLLLGSDPSSTCLNCHGQGPTLDSYHVATDATGYNGTSLPVQRTPGGDFSWLKCAFSTSSTTAGKGMSASYAAPASEAANRHGHHIVAADYSFLPSTDYASNLAPGGTYPAASLGCASCHNPHNNDVRAGETPGLPISISGSYGGTPVSGTAAGVYRLLGGIDYKIAAAAGGYTPAFTTAAPSAVAPSNYNASEASTQVRVAYGSGMSEWCANCHGDLINKNVDATTTHRHVASNTAKLSTSTPSGGVPATIYGLYVNSGNTTGSSNATSYLTLVPYEMGTSDNATMLAATLSTAGPTSGENVMCLSCHRAHASGFDSMTRWDMDDTFMTDTAGNFAFSNGNNGLSIDTTGYYQAAYYDRDSHAVFGPSQRSLCNKCHVKA